MNAPLPLSWPIVVVVALNLCVVAYVLGTNRMTRYQDSRIEWVVGENGRLRTALRRLYAATEYEWPDLDELDDEPEPQPRWYRRAWDRLKGAQAPTVMGTRVVEAEPIAETVPTEAERQAAAEADGFTPDPNPATSPIVMPEPVGIPTQPDLKQAAQVSPLAALTDEEWEQQQRAQLEAWRQEQEAKWGVVR